MTFAEIKKTVEENNNLIVSIIIDNSTGTTIKVITPQSKIIVKSIKQKYNPIGKITNLAPPNIKLKKIIWCTIKKTLRLSAEPQSTIFYKLSLFKSTLYYLHGNS